MICPNCQAEIGEGKKFCGKCGAALRAISAVSVPVQPSSVSCPACGSKESPDVKFCGVCGRALGEEALGRPAKRPSPVVIVSVTAAVVVLLSGVAWYVFGHGLHATKSSERENVAQPGTPNQDFVATPEVYLPLKEGAVFRYRTTVFNMPGHRNGTSELVVLAPRELNGRRVVPRRDISSNGNLPFIFFFTEDNDGVSWVATQVGDDGELRELPRPQYSLKAPIRLGTTWDDTTSVTEVNGHGTGVTLRAAFERTDEIVTVPAGTFKKCLKVKLVGATDEMSFQLSRWYAPGVGLLKILDERQPLNRSAPFQQQITELEEFKLPERH